MRLVILAFIIFSSLLLAHDSEYIHVDDFFIKFPEEKLKHENFNTLVQNNPIKVSKKQLKPIKISIVYPGKQIGDYWRRSKVSFEKRLQKLGIEYELKDYFTKPNTEIREQARQILESINDGSDYLIFTLEATKHKKLIEQLRRVQKPKLILQNITTPLKEWKERGPFLYVGFDHIEGSKMIADYLIKTVSKNAKYGVLFHTKDGYLSEMRGDSFIDYIDKNTDFKLVDSYYTEMDFDRAYNSTKALVEKNPNLDFIYACSTDIAYGALRALKELQRKDIIINGWGGGTKELASIKNGDLAVTAMRMNDDNGIAMAEAIKLDLERRGDEIPTVFSGKIELINSQNIDKVDALIDRAFIYSGRQ
ncbi:MAG: substrate-binding domain-containing protein [Campylobacterales bacterium]